MPSRPPSPNRPDDLASMPTMGAGRNFSSSPTSAGDLDSMATMGAAYRSHSPPLGRIDHYELLAKLGGGGFGVVYLARDTVSGIDVAVKTVHPMLKRDVEAMEGLRQRFSLVARLSHPNIATALVLHLARDIDIPDETARQELRLAPGDSVMVMRYAPGSTLSRWRKQFPNGIVPLDLALEIAHQLASALDYAHGERIVHRDIKPGNIMIETLRADEPRGASDHEVEKQDGIRNGGASRPGEPPLVTRHPSLVTSKIRVRILDFGLAAEIRSSLSRISSEPGDTSGTRPYMSPEQWAGRKQDGRTDQYALACVLYELLSGEPPFSGAFETGDPVIMMTAVEHHRPEPVRGLSAAANAVLLRALAKSPKDRFASCSEFVESMKHALRKRGTGRAVAARRVFAVAATAVVVASAALVLIHSVQRQDRERKEVARLAEEKRRAEEEAARKAEAERLEQERRAEAERLAAEKRRAEEEAARKAEAERLEQERRAEAERLAAEKQRAEEEAARKAEAERLEQERLAATDKTVDEAGKMDAGVARAKNEDSAKPVTDREIASNDFTAAGDRKVLSIGGVDVAFRWCPPGSFMMGSASNENGNETQHVVTLTMGFWIGETEVTQELWQKVMGYNPSYHTKEGPYPVENVSWNDCQKFVKKLNNRSDVMAIGARFELPTEAQWEYACRAGTSGRYAGTGRLDDLGWYNGNSRGTLHPVAQKKPNAWGLHDMHGNVWEWCSDWYGAYPSKAVTDPTGAASDDNRIQRGGCFWTSSQYCRSASRHGSPPVDSRAGEGFRLVVFLPPSTAKTTAASRSST